MKNAYIVSFNKDEIDMITNNRIGKYGYFDNIENILNFIELFAIISEQESKEAYIIQIEFNETDLKHKGFITNEDEIEVIRVCSMKEIELLGMLT